MDRQVNHIKQIYVEINAMHNAVKEKFNEIDNRLKNIENRITKIENAVLYTETCILKLNQKSVKQTRYLRILNDNL
jgi:septal ring factor EnvC (AmiA/AmiB activator)